MKKRILLSTLLVAGVLSVLAGGQADAAVIDSKVDLKGYDAKIVTKEDGTNVLTSKIGTYELDESAEIYSSKGIVVYLDNSTPVKIDSIYAKKDIEFRGKGELELETDGEFAINAGNHLKAFKDTKYGEGKVTATGKTAGIHVENEIQMDGGSLSGYGADYGVWSNNDIKPYHSAVLKGVASGTDSVGIWAYRDIYAWKGATVSGEGGASGAYSEIAHIQAEDKGSITGISRNIRSKLSALHAQKKMLRAYSGGSVNEVYPDSTFPAVRNVPFDVVGNYQTVARNLTDVTKYQWETSPTSNVKAVAEGLVFDVSVNEVTGTRVADDKKADETEPTQLKQGGIHTIKFGDILLAGN